MTILYFHLKAHTPLTPIGRPVHPGRWFLDSDRTSALPAFSLHRKSLTSGEWHFIQWHICISYSPVSSGNGMMWWCSQLHINVSDMSVRIIATRRMDQECLQNVYNKQFMTSIGILAPTYRALTYLSNTGSSPQTKHVVVSELYALGCCPVYSWLILQPKGPL